MTVLYSIQYVLQGSSMPLNITRDGACSQEKSGKNTAEGINMDQSQLILFYKQL